AEPAHHLAEHPTQPLLLAGGIAHLAGVSGLRLLVARLLSGLTWLAGLAAAVLLPALALLPLLALLTLSAEAAIEQLLLALHQVPQAAHHLLRLAGALLRHLAGPGGTQVFQ